MLKHFRKQKWRGRGGERKEIALPVSLCTRVRFRNKDPNKSLSKETSPALCLAACKATAKPTKLPICNTCAATSPAPRISPLEHPPPLPSPPPTLSSALQKEDAGGNRVRAPSPVCLQTPSRLHLFPLPLSSSAASLPPLLLPELSQPLWRGKGGPHFSNGRKQRWGGGWGGCAVRRGVRMVLLWVSGSLI